MTHEIQEPRSLPFPDGSFPDTDAHRRVLIESSDPCLGWAAGDLLREEGFAVAMCWARGPGGPASCPMIDVGWCPLVEAADVIVQSFEAAERKGFPILEVIRDAYPEKQICVDDPRGGWQVLEEWARTGAIDTRTAPARLVDAVREAVHRYSD
jgi:hypothetical protein